MPDPKPTERPSDKLSLKELEERAEHCFANGHIQQSCRYIKEAVLRCEASGTDVPQPFRLLTSKIMNFDEAVTQAAETLQ